MTTDNYINQNKTETFKKGDKVMRYDASTSVLQKK